MLRFFLFLGLLLKANDSFSQTSATLGANEVKEDWMQMGQDYWIVPVVDKGIYRISADELIKKGFPGVEDTLNFQYELFSLGVPIAMLIHHDKENGAVSYLEFYGEGDEGKSDDLLFKEEKSSRLNPLFSLFTDTAYYFLSWQQKTNESVRQANRVDLPLIKKSDQGIIRLKEQVVYKDRHAKVGITP
jgi:hypothetical protein